MEAADRQRQTAGASQPEAVRAVDAEQIDGWTDRRTDGGGVRGGAACERTGAPARLPAHPAPSRPSALEPPNPQAPPRHTALMGGAEAASLPGCKQRWKMLKGPASRSLAHSLTATNNRSSSGAGHNHGRGCAVQFSRSGGRFNPLSLLLWFGF